MNKWRFLMFEGRNRKDLAVRKGGAKFAKFLSLDAEEGKVSSTFAKTLKMDPAPPVISVFYSRSF